MNIRCNFILLAFLAIDLCAQPVSIGVRGGVPITDAFDTVRGDSRAFATNTKRYVVGPALQFNLPAHFAIEVDALYKRIGYQYDQFAPSSPAYARTVANAWEFPFLVKFALLPGPVRPYVQGGGSVRHISGIKQFQRFIDATGTVIQREIETAPEFNKRNDLGLVFGGGVEVRLGRLRISPEVRYTRWGSENFRDPIQSLLQTNRNQADFLIGILF